MTTTEAIAEDILEIGGAEAMVVGLRRSRAGLGGADAVPSHYDDGDYANDDDDELVVSEKTTRILR